MRSVTVRFVMAVTVLGVARGQEYGEGHALFVRTPFADAHSRVQRSAPASSADVVVQNILEWIQGIYQQGARKPRQQSDPPGYLPPYSTQRPPERPRPFQAPSASGNQATGFPYPKPSTLYNPPSFDYSSTAQASPYSTPEVSFSSPFAPSTSYDPLPTASPTYAAFGSSAFPPLSSSTYLPPSSLSPSYASSASGGFSTNYGYSSSTFGNANSGTFSTPGGFSSTPGYSTQRPSSYGYPTKKPSPPFPTPSPGPSSKGSAEGTPRRKQPGEETASGSAKPSTGGPIIENGSTGEEDDDDSNHPPHIHALDVKCGKTMMTINIEFNRAYDGIIYSKGYFAEPGCKYVEQDSGRTNYSFTVSLDTCGTQFINEFAGEAGQAYLENVLVLQNEPGIQEVWDTVHRVRCLWQGNINTALTANFSVDMLKQRTVTFQGDTAVAKLDIQVGKGPFSQSANGLVKIGEIMTLVVSVEGDPGFDLQVRDCLASSQSYTNTIQLTDERGCILKPKLFGAFQKTNDTGNTGASIIAYAYFQAFKFPDVMDLFIECNVELCKTECEPCTEPGQQIEPGRRRRSIPYAPTKLARNASTELLSDPVRVGRGFKVIMVEDLSTASTQVLEQLEETAIEEIRRTTATVCMTYTGFYLAITFMLGTIVATTISTAALYVRLQRVYRAKLGAS